LKPSFLQQYLQAFSVIQGWFQFDAALMFMAYNQLQAGSGASGDVLEIGVYHVLSSIGVAALRGAGRRFVVVDPFDNSSETNAAMYGNGIRDHFERNFSGFYPDAEFLRVIARPSLGLTTADIGTGFTFCHIDGGHSREETYNDLALCHDALAGGGLLAIDDYFNPQHPGVCEGAAEFLLRYAGAIRPLAIAYNKVLFQKGVGTTNLNVKFLAAFPAVKHEIVTMWGCPVILLASPLRDYLDLYGSTPDRFIPLGAAGTRAMLQPSTDDLRVRPGRDFALEVQIGNSSGESTPFGKNVFGLSYHLLAASGAVLRHDNERAWITTPIHPGERRIAQLTVRSPETPGEYILELDLVWEGVMWFKEVANPVARVRLAVA
jgi:hypothetical protein